jgi:hypothetical protein
MSRFPITFSPWLRWLFAILFTWRDNSYIEVSRAELHLHFGPLFSMRAPLSRVRSIRRERDLWWAIGVHTDFRGRWAVNGSPRNMVSIEFEPPTRGWMLAVIPARVRQLLVSVEDVDRLIAAVHH